jgi:quercetin dioxygenase-like cupin family protein
VTPLSDVPAVEPLGDACWKRIENSVFAELDREPGAAPERPARTARVRRPAWALAGFAAAAVAAVIGLVVLQGRDNEGAGAAFEPSRIVTADSPARLTLGHAAITVAPQSSLWIRGAESRGVQVMLESGRVDCAVPPRRDRSAFVVQAGDVRVEVVGTRFSVERHGGEVSVQVSKGVVTVYHDGERIELGAGQSWPAAPGAAGASDASESTDAAYEGRGATAGQDRASNSRGASRARARASAARELYERAAGLEASEPDKARAIYDEIIGLGGPWAANALFAQARLELDLGDRARASALLRTYLQRYPEGANAADARELLDRR